MSNPNVDAIAEMIDAENDRVQQEPASNVDRFMWLEFIDRAEFEKRCAEQDSIDEDGGERNDAANRHGQGPSLQIYVRAPADEPKDQDAYNQPVLDALLRDFDGNNPYPEGPMYLDWMGFRIFVSA